MQDPLKGAALVVIHGAKDVVVPFGEVGILLIKKIEFIHEELIEMPKHKRGW